MDTAVPAARLLDHVPAGLVFLDGRGVVRWCNPPLADLLGRAPDALLGQDAQGADEDGVKLLLGGAETVYLPAAPGREERWLMCRWEAVDDGRLGHCCDVTEAHQLEMELAQLRRQLEDCRTTDPATGLLNERALLQTLEPQLARCRRYGTELSLVVLHLDGCDRAPQSDQEAAGALVVVARVLRDQLRWADIIARLAPEPQFVIALPETPTEGALSLARKLRTAFAALTLSPAQRACLEPNSFGVTAWQRGDDAKGLLRRAQTLRLTARGAGGEQLLLG
ncbi:diguanylate cyclase [Ectothiorhodospiraceae bacterium 2226]|nr:diguanylate cyclase [Ectothiorhodospiraceae bacterium 2226]